MYVYTTSIPIQDQTFKKIISMFSERLTNGDTLEQAVEYHYDLCDYDFMQLLKAKTDWPIDENDMFDYNDLLNEITKTSAKKIGGAQQKLETILKKGTLCICIYVLHDSMILR